jgi:hypothetical protein
MPCDDFCCILTIPDRLECPPADDAAWTEGWTAAINHHKSRLFPLVNEDR